MCKPPPAGGEGSEGHGTGEWRVLEHEGRSRELPGSGREASGAPKGGKGDSLESVPGAPSSSVSSRPLNCAPQPSNAPRVLRCLKSCLGKSSQSPPFVPAPCSAQLLKEMLAHTLSPQPPVLLLKVDIATSPPNCLCQKTGHRPFPSTSLSLQHPSMGSLLPWKALSRLL